VGLCGQSDNQQKCKQVVFPNTGWGGTETAIDVQNGQLRYYKPIPLEGKGTGLSVDGQKFYLDLKLAKSRFKQHDAQGHLAIKDGALRFDGQPVSFSKDVKMIEVYGAILWQGWVICLGRTSNSDSLVALKPPFVATELVAFSASERVAQLKFLNSVAPTNLRLYILDSCDAPQN
jgi:hypothetical protein